VKGWPHSIGEFAFGFHCGNEGRERRQTVLLLALMLWTQTVKPFLILNL
jgi:hypothetical protein